MVEKNLASDENVSLRESSVMMQYGKTRSFEYPRTKPPNVLKSLVLGCLLIPLIFSIVVISVPVNLLMWIMQIIRAPFLYYRLRNLEKKNWINKKGKVFEDLKDKNILIIGGGIGGLSMAHFLLKCGFRKVKVFEKHENCGLNRGGGHGLIAGRWCFDKMGMEEVFNKTCQAVHTWNFDSGRWWLTAKVHLQPVLHSNWCLPLTRFAPGNFVRSDFLKFLVDTLPSSNMLYLNHDLEKVTESENGVKVLFSNGMMYKGSLLIGCDGSKSRVRDLVFEENLNDAPFYVDMNVWWCITPTKDISIEDLSSMKQFSWEPGPHRYYFEGGAIMHLVSKEQIILVVDYRAPSLLNHHQNWAGNATCAQLMEFMKVWGIPQQYWPVAKYASRVSHFAIPKGLSTQTSSSQWWRQKTVLIGDAVHPTPHFFGQGANAAIQDAYCLTRHLSTANDLQRAFQSYVSIRKPPADDIIAKSYFLGLTETAGGLARFLRDIIFFTIIKTGLFIWPSLDIMSVRV